MCREAGESSAGVGSCTELCRPALEALPFAVALDVRLPACKISSCASRRTTHAAS